MPLLRARVCLNSLHASLHAARSAKLVRSHPRVHTTGSVSSHATLALSSALRSAEVRCTKLDKWWSDVSGKGGTAMCTLVSNLAYPRRIAWLRGALIPLPPHRRGGREDGEVPGVIGSPGGEEEDCGLLEVDCAVGRGQVLSGEQNRHLACSTSLPLPRYHEHARPTCDHGKCRRCPNRHRGSLKDPTPHLPGYWSRWPPPAGSGPGAGGQGTRRISATSELGRGAVRLDLRRLEIQQYLGRDLRMRGPRSQKRRQVVAVVQSEGGSSGGRGLARGRGRERRRCNSRERGSFNGRERRGCPGR